MPTLYKIIPISDLENKLSTTGEKLLLSARHSNDRTKIIRCINHPEEIIALTFKDGFDYVSFLSNYETLTKEQSLAEMQTAEWSTEMTSDL